MVVAIAITVVSGILFVAFGLKDNSIAKDDYRTRFNIFANYLLYGNDSKGDIGEVDPYVEYYVDQHYKEDKYMTSLAQKFEDFNSAISASETKVFDGLAIPLIKEKINFLDDVDGMVLPNYDEVLNIYKESGASGARDYIDKLYDVVDEDESKNVFVRSIEEDVVRFFNKQLSIWENGIIQDDDVDMQIFVEPIVSANLRALKNFCIDVMLNMEFENAED